MMTNQEIFDTVVRKMADQSWKQSANETGCKYRYNGMVCAAGALLKDEFYNPDFERKSVENPTVSEALQKSGVRAFQIPFVSQLQKAHDRPFLHEYMKERFRALAKKNNLSTNVLDDL